MINSAIALTRRGVEYLKQHPQLAMTLVLVVFIPVAFLISGQQFLNAARENQERLEKDRVGLFHDIFAAYMRGVEFDHERIQEEIDEIAAINPDIARFRVATEEGNDVRIIAALDHTSVNGLAADPNTYRIGNTNPNESIIAPYVRNGVRYWQSFRLVRTPEGADYYIFTETSLEHIDELFAARIMNAYYWLIGLLAITFVLIARHVRLIDYSYLYRETKKANEMKDLFTNMIAHELRAPLTAMRGYASMIRENESLEEQVRKRAGRIEESANRLILIINDLLDVARMQSGKFSISFESVPITNVASSVVDALQPIAEQKHVSLTIEKPSEEIIVQGDEKRLYQALTNVVNNAIKYTEQGSVAVTVERRVDRVEIRVKDTGMGISSENQKRLFAPFFRVDDKETTAVTGTGLGMWITKQLIELMHGSIGVESIKGVGTHVVITLPL